MSRIDRLSEPQFVDVVFRSPANWTAVGFLALLGGLHLSIAVPTLMEGRWEGYLSLLLGGLFLMAAGVVSAFRYEVAMLASSRQVRMRTGVGRLRSERFVPFEIIHGVRLTLACGRRRTEPRIELLCPIEDIELPPTHVPRQEALLLAIMLNVPLIKVSEEGNPRVAANEKIVAN
jgi:hypothetical protein